AGLVITLKITVTAVVVGIVWGTILAVMRLSSFTPIAWFAKAYTPDSPVALADVRTGSHAGLNAHFLRLFHKAAGNATNRFRHGG
ncbi:hypothetical protein MJN51_39960, partial [Salmonella enterica subsp. enterica serovar Kentucky]|nr:hypothetical protein [Salmonella enterica subsp. enterica serovar Kentucky]